MLDAQPARFPSYRDLSSLNRKVQFQAVDYTTCVSGKMCLISTNSYPELTGYHKGHSLCPKVLNFSAVHFVYFPFITLAFVVKFKDSSLNRGHEDLPLFSSRSFSSLINF